MLRRSRRWRCGGEVNAGAGEDGADGDERGEEERGASADPVQMGLRAHFGLVIKTQASPQSLTSLLADLAASSLLFSIFHPTSTLTMTSFVN